MSAERPAVRVVDDLPPWSPLSVSIITLLLPAGGAILTVRNLHRLRQIDASNTVQLTYAAYVIFALGLTAMLLSAHKGPNGLLQPDANASTVLSCGVALASYLVQRAPYRTWRIAHLHVRPSPWLAGAGRAILYTLITFAAVLPLAVLGMALGLTGFNASAL